MALPSAPAWALLAGAALWGVVWYPYRLLGHAGIDGTWSTLLTYGLALAAAVACFPRDALSLRRVTAPAVLMGLALGWSNLAYVVAVVEGEVMRVLLLFYLAPLWTVPLAYFLLREVPGRAGLAVMGLALAGAVTMLWRPGPDLPWPASRADWLGVVAGLLFALGNVLVRRLEHMSVAAKSIVIWCGATIAALVHLPGSALAPGRAWDLAVAQSPMIAAIAMALLGMGLALQYGLSRLPANRAIVILLSELVVAAVAAYILAGEKLGTQDWIGGALIVLATIASGWKSRPSRG